jgi:hypothetical protein
MNINVEDVLASDIEQKYRKEYLDKWEESQASIAAAKSRLELDLQAFEDNKKKMNELFMERLDKEKIKLQESIQAETQRKLSEEFMQRIALLESNNSANVAKLREARERELQLLKNEQALKSKEEELELTMQKRMQEEREALTAGIRNQEAEKSRLQQSEMQFKLKELQMQLEEQKKLADEMKRRAEQGSMQRQGETQELMLEQVLREHFPFDEIEEVGKGVEGADCIQVVRNTLGEPCGRIIFESKRTKNWQAGWLEKLKTDQRNKKADIGILVTQVLPKDMDRFGEREGIWICGFTEVAAVAGILRKGILSVHELSKSQENKGEKMQMLYDYLTGKEFRGQLEAIMEGFMAMKNGISRERVQMEKLWKEREKQLEKVLINTSGMFGSVKGIAGASIADIPLLEGNATDENPLPEA